ncbi:MAG TPA: cyclic nucleotide-binding domain-containing protein [Thermodesulfobacteriota bacterium]
MDNSTTINLFQQADDFESFPAGQIVFKEGQPGEVMYVVKEGEVDILIDDKLCETVGPGGILGELALIDDKPRSATAIAKSDCKLVPIDESGSNFLFSRLHFFRFRL